jgi:hypothetical protein
MAVCQRRFQSDVRDDVFEDHYKAFQFPTADEPVVHVVEGFDLQSWLIGTVGAGEDSGQVATHVDPDHHRED